MPRGYRLLIISAGGIAILTALGVGAFFGSLYGPDRKHYEAIAGDKAGQKDYQGPSQSLPDIAGLPGFVERAIANRRSQTGHDHEKRDLAAQEASALWAFWMVLASFLSVLITAVGTIFLYKQIVLTREAVQDTGKATIAMQEANEISRHALESQQRPVITLGPIDVNVENFLKGSFTIENIGLGIARIIKCTAFTTRTPRQGEIDMPMTKIVEVQYPVRIMTSGLLVSQGRNRCEFGVGTMRHLERQCIKTRIVLEYANAVGEKTTMFTSEVYGEFRPVTESEGLRGMYMGDRVIPNIVDAVFDIDQTTWKMT